MKISRFFLLWGIGILLLLLTATSCGDKACQEDFFDYSLNVKILLQDRITGEALIGAFGRRYDTDLGVFLTDTDRNEIPLLVLDDILSFNIELDNTTEVNEVVSAQYFLDLPPWDDNAERDVDTLRFEITLSELPGECSFLEFGDMEYYFNDNLFFRGNPNTLGNQEYLIGEK